MVIDTNGHDLNIIIYDDTTEDILQKLIYNTQRNNICKVWVNDENIYQRGSQRRIDILLWQFINNNVFSKIYGLWSYLLYKIKK